MTRVRAHAEVLERDPELARLDAALSSAVAGRGRVVFVEGEAGIGKTALIEHFASSVEAPTRVAVGRCDSLGTPRALGPFVDAAASLGLAPADDRDGLLGRLIGYIRDTVPVLLVVEDAHWADDGTVDLVAVIGRRAADLPLLLVVTYRDDEVGADHPLRRALGDLATSSRASWIGLSPLSIDAVRRLAGSQATRAEEVMVLTGGNPFFVTEVLAAPPGTLSTSVRLAVLARASRLPSPARQTLDAAATVPGKVEHWLLQAMCDASASTIAHCLDAGVLVAVDDGYAFRHDLARQVIEDELAVVRRRQLHGRAATVLVGRRGSDPARIAHHAGLAGDGATFARASAAACRLAVARGAVTEAVEHGLRAHAEAGVLSADERAELAHHLVQALHSAARFDEGIAIIEEAVEHWRRQGDGPREAEALNVLGSLLVARGRTDEGMANAQRAVELLERAPPGAQLAAAYVRLTSMHMLARERDTAAVWGERAVALANEVGDPAVLGQALIAYGIADVMDLRFDGLARVRRAIDLGHRHRLPGVVAIGLSMIGTGCGELRRYDLAVPALVEGAGFAGEHHLEYNRQYMVAWLRCRFDLGQWEDAERHALDVLGATRRVDIAAFVALNTLGWLRARRGDDDVWPMLDEVLEFARLTGHLQRLWPCAVARAEAGWLVGQLDRHVDLLEESLALARRCRHQLAAAELGCWLRRAGRDVPEPLLTAADEPFEAWVHGDAASAAAGFDALGCPYEAASALVATGDVSALRRALATFERLGALPGVEWTVERLRASGVTVTPHGGAPSTGGNPGGLSDREVEVLRLVAAGFSNPQIAGALFISRKTAEHHVSHILTKLGITTRAEAAAASVRRRCCARSPRATRTEPTPGRPTSAGRPGRVTKGTCEVRSGAMGNTEIRSVGDIVRVHAGATPDATALSLGDRSVSWSELYERARRVASGLAAAGVGPRDRVAFLDKNGVEHFEVMYGAALGNAVCVDVNWRLAAQEVAFIVDDCAAKVLVVGPDFLPVLDGLAGRLTTEPLVLVIGGHPEHQDYDNWVAGQAADVPQVPSAPDDVALQLYSSGTTGRPKGVMLSNDNVIGLLPAAGELWEMTPDSVVLVAMPLFHIGGSGWATVAHFIGARLEILRDIDMAELVHLFSTRGVTHAFVVPAVLQFMQLVPGVAEADFSSLQLIVYGASPISEEVLAASIKLLGCKFFQVYGLTETTGAITHLPDSDHDLAGPNLHRLRSCGVPGPGVELRIVDVAGDGDISEPDVPGEVLVRSKQVMRGYWNNPEATREAIDEDGWFRTGDIGYLDADGYLYIHDRVKDMIVSGGENIYPAEVENVLMSHPAVADVAVIGVPSERWGESPRAIVVAAPDAEVTEGELIDFTREHLARFKCPTGIDFTDALPRNPSGKILKKDLRAPYWEGRNRQVN